MPAAFVQSVSNTSTSGASITATFASAQGAGDLIVVYFCWFNSGSTSSISSVTDTSGNTYHVGVPAFFAPGPTEYNVAYYAWNIAAAAAGANTITINFAVTLNFYAILAAEYSGIQNTSDPLIGSGTNQAASGSAVSVTFTATGSGICVCGAESLNGMAGPGTGYTQRILTNPFNVLLEDNLSIAAGSVTAPSVNANTSAWSTLAMAFAVPSSASVAEYLESHEVGAYVPMGSKWAASESLFFPFDPLPPPTLDHWIWFDEPVRPPPRRRSPVDNDLFVGDRMALSVSALLAPDVAYRPPIRFRDPHVDPLLGTLNPRFPRPLWTWGDDPPQRPPIRQRPIDADAFVGDRMALSVSAILAPDTAQRAPLKDRQPDTFIGSRMQQFVRSLLDPVDPAHPRFSRPPEPIAWVMSATVPPVVRPYLAPPELAQRAPLRAGEDPTWVFDQHAGTALSGYLASVDVAARRPIALPSDLFPVFDAVSLRSLGWLDASATTGWRGIRTADDAGPVFPALQPRTFGWIDAGVAPVRPPRRAAAAGEDWVWRSLQTRTFGWLEAVVPMVRPPRDRALSDDWVPIDRRPPPPMGAYPFATDAVQRPPIRADGAVVALFWSSTRGIPVVLQGGRIMVLVHLGDPSGAPLVELRGRVGVSLVELDGAASEVLLVLGDDGERGSRG